MSKQNPRIALTVPNDLNYVLQRLSDLQGIPKTRIILNIVTGKQIGRAHV